MGGLGLDWDGGLGEEDRDDWGEGWVLEIVLGLGAGWGAGWGAD